MGDLERTDRNLQNYAIAKSNAITAIRQAAEWGMGAVEKCYRRLLQPLPYNPQVRRKRLCNIHRLYNLRVRRTGISQIRSTFIQHGDLEDEGN